MKLQGRFMHHPPLLLQTHKTPWKSLKSQQTRKTLLPQEKTEVTGLENSQGSIYQLMLWVWKMIILPSVSSISTEHASGITKAGQWTGNLSRRQRIVFLREPQQQEKNVQHQNTRERKAESHMLEVQMLSYKVISFILTHSNPAVSLGYHEIQQCE